jgi:hypothetical protein
VTDTALHFALREWRAHITDRRTLGIGICAAGALALAGPFGTTEALRFVPRLVYWAFLAFASYSVPAPSGVRAPLTKSPPVLRSVTW